MPELRIEEVSPELQRKLEESAARNGRSLEEEALALLERELGRPARTTSPSAPFEARLQLNQEFLEEARKTGRA